MIHLTQFWLWGCNRVVLIKSNLPLQLVEIPHGAPSFFILAPHSLNINFVLSSLTPETHNDFQYKILHSHESPETHNDFQYKVIHSHESTWTVWHQDLKVKLSWTHENLYKSTDSGTKPCVRNTKLSRLTMQTTVTSNWWTTESAVNVANKGYQIEHSDSWCQRISDN